VSRHFAGWMSIGVTALALSACSESSPSKPFAPVATRPGHGVDESQAIAAARTFVPVGQGAPIYAGLGPMRPFMRAGEQFPGPNEYAWTIVFRGSFPPPSCGPYVPPGNSPHPCPRPVTTMAVYVDYASGQALSGAAPAPSPFASLGP
jgi:hypothetical protein